MITARLHPLTRTHTAHLLVLETCQHVRDQCRWPDSVVVREEDDICGRILDSMSHLQSLVREGNGQDTYTFGINGVGKVLQRPEHLLFGDDDDLFGLADEPRVSGFFEFFTGVDSGDDDGDILRGDVRWVVWKWDRAIDESGEETDAVPEVPVESEEKKQVVSETWSYGTCQDRVE